MITFISAALGTSGTGFGSGTLAATIGTSVGLGDGVGIGADGEDGVEAVEAVDEGIAETLRPALLVGVSAGIGDKVAVAEGATVGECVGVRVGLGVSVAVALEVGLGIVGIGVAGTRVGMRSAAAVGKADVLAGKGRPLVSVGLSAAQPGFRMRMSSMQIKATRIRSAFTIQRFSWSLSKRS